MKISTSIAQIARIAGEEKAVECFGKVGFDAWDLSMHLAMAYDWKLKKAVQTDSPLAAPDRLAFVRKLRRIGEDYGMVCNQSHAPFPSSCPELRDWLKIAIECTAEAGGEICVIHPDNDGTPEQNAEMYHELLPFAKSCGVKIATENMFNWDGKNHTSTFAACATAKSFVEHLDAVNDDFLVACLDIGHAELRTSGDGAVPMIHALGDRLQALHLQDNDGRTDMHDIPFNQTIDFDPVVKALKEIGYKGYFTLEARLDPKVYTPDNVLDGAKIMAQSARRLADMYEVY